MLSLTTAASILFAAAVGVCVALSQSVLAVGVTVLVLATLRGSGFVEHWLGQRENDQENDGHFAEDELCVGDDSHESESIS